MTPVRLEPAALCSRVKHSTTALLGIKREKDSLITLGMSYYCPYLDVSEYSVLSYLHTFVHFCLFYASNLTRVLTVHLVDSRC